MSDEYLSEAQKALIDYVLGADPVYAFLEPYLNLLPGGDQENLVAILTTLAPTNTERQPSPRRLHVQPLALTRQVVMNEGLDNVDIDAAFMADWEQAQERSWDFDKAAEVIRKHFWAVPGNSGEAGVSLYEEFKLLSALVHASGGSPQPNDAFTLITGDFPGVQRVIYLIASKGATKGLRGRSFFLQLLGDAVVRRLLYEFHLPWTNVIYTAGGNFVLLAGAGVEEKVTEIGKEFNDRLLDSFSGDISLSLVYEPIGQEELYGDFFITHWRNLKGTLGLAKQQPFYHQVDTNWNGVFEPSGVIIQVDERTIFNCHVCHRQPEERDLQANGQIVGRIREEGWVCDRCLVFEELGRDLAIKHHYLSVDWVPETNGVIEWQRLLHQLSGGLCYELHEQAESIQLSDEYGRLYALNDTDFVDVGADGFRFVSTQTPLDYTGEAIRDFEALAEDSDGIARIGILRMDVDDLGRIFGSYIHDLSLTRISAASAAMSLFFDGWLNKICTDFEVEQNKPNSLYVIYAGGDDLFIVGPWNLTPLLAERIRNDLVEYTNANPHITISAGISITGPHYPLYRSAELARIALDDQAKGREDKNAIAMLGQVIGWGDEWNLLIREHERMRTLLEHGVPEALIQTVRQVYMAYLNDPGRQQQLHFGRWMWLQMYYLTRLARPYRGRNEMIVRDIRELQDNLLTPDRVYLAGLAARWTEYLRRKGEEA